MTEIRLLGPGDLAFLDHVAQGVFEGSIREEWAREFLDDPRHHLVVALDGNTVVGFASGVHYLHPDKPSQLWINEVGVSPSHRRQGLGTGLLRTLLDHGRKLGCSEAWIITEGENAGARAFYAGLGWAGAPAGALLFTVDLR